MKSIHYNPPATLKREKELLEAKCDLLIEAFNQLCDEESKRLREEEKAALAARVFTYSIKELPDGWRILYKESISEPIREDDKQWSTPFKIINGVLLHGESAYNNKHWFNATKLIPQGLFDEAQLETLNQGW